DYDPIGLDRIKVYFFCLSVIFSETGLHFFGIMLSRLLDLDQRSAEILGVQEQHRLAVSADLGLAVSQHARAALTQTIARRSDIAHLITDVMDAALRIAREEVGNWR